MDSSEAPKKAGSRSKSKPKKDFLTVGIGASAGGVKALKEFFAKMPADSGMAFVVVLHLSQTHESNLAAILQRETKMPVVQVAEATIIEPNRVYVVPPAKGLEMVDGMVRLTDRTRPRGQRVIIDRFFRTLADANGEAAVGVVLSGAGEDGTLGIKRIKELNGFAIAQKPEDAEFEQMPLSAIATGIVDWVLPISEMPEKLLSLRQSTENLNLTAEDDKEFVKELKGTEALRDILTILRVRTGHDFSNYKQATLLRRIARHLQIYELEDLPSYVKLLRENPDEADFLLKNLLINVTNFFRDRHAFEILEAEVIPRVFAGKNSDDQIRVWCAGCATGEEAYSVAMLLYEYASKNEDAPKIQIFASDVDDEAIAQARNGFFPEAITADISPERLKRFFVKENKGYRVKKELREMILFAPHNILRDPPFSKLDLITCRNLMIYLNRDTQERLMQLFHFALHSDGLLFLGSSESADSVPLLFTPFNKKQRIYLRRPTNPVAHPPLALPVQDKWQAKPGVVAPRAGGRSLSFEELHYRLLEKYAPPSVLINEDYEIVHLSENVGCFLNFIGGEPTNNLLKVANTDLIPDLRTALFTAKQDRQRAYIRRIHASIGGAPKLVDLTVQPIEAPDATGDFMLVIFEETETSDAPLQEIEFAPRADARGAMDVLARHLEEELQRTKDRLRVTIEQYDTSIEELKAANEELQAINEELRSATEELETSKEELQSVNEELTTVNHELKEKIDELSVVNSDLQNLMYSTDIATIFLDRNLQIKRFTQPAQEIFNIINSDTGRPLEHLTNRLNYKNFSEDARQVLRKLKPIEIEVGSDNGKSYIARILPYRTLDDRIDGIVLTFIDITERKSAEEALRASERRLQRMVNVEGVGVITFDYEGTLLHANDAFLRIVGYTREAFAAQKLTWHDFTPPEYTDASERIMEQVIETGRGGPYEKEYIRKDGSRVWLMFVAADLGDGTICEYAIDISDRKRAEEGLRESEEKYRALFDSVDEGLGIVEVVYDADGKIGDLIIVESNPVFRRLRNLPDVARLSVLQLVPDLDRGWFDVYDRVLRSGKPEREEYWVDAVGRWFTAYISRIGGEGSRLTAVIFDDITERKRAEERQAFLLKLSDALRSTSDAVTVEGIVTQMALEHFAADRCYYCTIEGDAAVVRRDALRGDLPSVAGTYPLEDSPIFKSAIDEGRTLVVRDVHTSDIHDDGLRAICIELKIISFVIVPVTKNKKTVGLFCLVQTAPRDWSPTEVELATETAERTWAAVERARAEEALRESEEKFRTLFETIDEGFCVQELVFDKRGRIADIIYRDANRAFEHHIGLGDVVGKRASEIFPHIEQDWFDALARVHQTGVPERTEGYNTDTERWLTAHYSAVGGAGSRFITAVFNDITERKRAEERQAFLLKLSDALSPLSDAAEIKRTVTRLLGEHLNVNRAFYADAENGHWIVAKGYEQNVEPLPDVPFLMADFGQWIIEDFRAGRPLIVPDVRAEKRFKKSERDALAAIQIGAAAGVPLVKENTLVAMLCLHTAEPRDWNEQEIGLLREVAERTWAAVERGRAEELLRESEEKYRSLFDSIDQGVTSAEMIFDENGKVIDYWLVESNEAMERLTGLPPSISGKTAREILPDLQDEWFETWERVVKTGVPERRELEVAALNKWFDLYFCRIGGEGSRKAVAIYTNITERKRREFNQALLVEIGDELSRLTALDEIMQAVGERLGGNLNLSACLFADVNEAGDEVTVHHGWSNNDVPNLKVTYRIADYLTEEFQRVLRAGETFEVRDTGTDERTDAEAYARFKIGAFLAVPFHREGRWTAYLVAADSVPRDWRAEEIELLQEIASRVFPRIERARAEELLREREEKYRTLFNSIDEGYLLCEVIFDENDKPVDILYLEANPAAVRLAGRDFVGRRMREIDPDYEEYWYETLGRIARTGESVQAEYYAESHERWFDFRASKVGGQESRRVASIFQDTTERKRAEQALAFKSLLLDTVEQSVIATNLEGKVTYWNHFAEKLFGWTVEEAIGRDITELTPYETELEQAAEIMSRLRRGEKWSGEFKVRRRDGSQFLAHVFNVPILDEQENVIGIVGVATDMTDRKRIEEAVRRNQEMFSALVQNAPFGIYMVDADFCLRAINKGAQAVFGGIEPLIGRDFAEILRIVWKEPFATEAVARFRHTLETGESYYSPTLVEERGNIDKIESYDWQLHRIVLPDGTYNVVCYFYDLSDQKLMEKSLRESEEHLRLLVESVEDYAIITLTPEGLINSWNPGAEVIFGFAEQEILGKSAEIIFTPEDRAKGEPENELNTAREAGRASDERWHQRKDGSRFFASGVLTILGENAENGYVKILRDLTERKQFEDALREGDRRKDEFLATLAHELRNPLAPIRTALEIMRRDGEQEKSQNTREIIERQTNQLVHLVDDLLDISRITQGKIKLRTERIDISDPIRAAIETVQPFVELQRHKLDARLPDAPVFVEADRTRLTQIVFNLLHNSAKYTEPGGHILLIAAQEGDQAVIRIRDNGIGIQFEMLPAIFDMFAQTAIGERRGQGGLGIGLSLVKKLVEMHEGTVEAHSEGEGKGSEFIVRLPLAANQKPERKKEKQPTRETEEKPQPRRILVVDDNADAANMLEIYLSMENHSVRAAFNGRDALETAAEHKPDTAILDIGLPDMNGYELAKQLRAEFPEICLIALSGWGQDEDRRRSKEAGFNHHLVKPVDVEDLKKIL